MDIVTTGKYFRLSPKKARTISPNLKGMKVQHALDSLRFGNKKSANVIAKVLKLGLANAVHNYKMTADNVVVKTIEIVPGPTLKRFTARSRGMGHPILKRSSHVRITLTEVTGPETKAPKAAVNEAPVVTEEVKTQLVEQEAPQAPKKAKASSAKAKTSKKEVNDEEVEDGGTK